MVSFSYKPVCPALGVEVDIDLEQKLTDEVLTELHALYDEHHLLLFRNQQISEATQVRFATSFGPISRRSPAMKAKDTINVSNTDPNGVLGNGELLFHSDNTFFREPLQAIGLFGIVIPAEGGDTLFSNCEKVYAAMPKALRSKLESLTSYQVFDYNSTDYNKRLTLDRAPPEAPRAVHPLVWENPRTKKKVLFFSEHTTARINELDSGEEGKLFETLRALISDPEFTYRHKWKAGDFVFWDNVMLQHARTDFDSSQPRTLRRTPVLEMPGANRFPHSRNMSLVQTGA
jgi:alpha-ketoglutarate-dependent taurine dioxygenase